MVQVFDDVLDARSLRELQQYFHLEDGDRDIRPDVISKNPKPDADDWPKYHVRSALNQLLDQSYCIEEALFHQSWTQYYLHADTSQGSQHQALYKIVLFPLQFDGSAGTVFFKNHWYGASAKFTKAPYLKWQYNLPNRHGGNTHVADIREIRQRIDLGDRNLEQDFVINEDFISMLDHLIRVRNGDQNLLHSWVSDYSQISEITDLDFPEDLRQRYCSHVKAEDLVGLTFDQYVPWQPGSAIVFDRTQIHCTGNGDLGKLGLTVFTNLV